MMPNQQPYCSREITAKEEPDGAGSFIAQDLWWTQHDVLKIMSRLYQPYLNWYTRCLDLMCYPSIGARFELKDTYFDKLDEQEKGLGDAIRLPD